jgi:rhodanese-related sulfurtransferase
VETGKVQLLDVRDKDEWDKGHATNAIHIPLAVLVEGINPSLKKDAPLYVYCESGRRSGLAESILKSQGYQAISIGGLNDWTQAGGKLEN